MGWINFSFLTALNLFKMKSDAKLIHLAMYINFGHLWYLFLHRVLGEIYVLIIEVLL